MTDESALLVTVPAAEPAVARHRSRLDTSAAVGVPAHITVLYPFLPPDLIDADTHATLTRLFASVPGFRFTLDRTRWFPDPVLWLGPSDPAPFSALTGLVAAGFPSCPPYGGQVAEVIPHLTIGDGAPRAELEAAGRSPPAPPHRNESHLGHADDWPATGLRPHRCPLDDSGDVFPRLVTTWRGRRARP